MQKEPTPRLTTNKEFTPGRRTTQDRPGGNQPSLVRFFAGSPLAKAKAKPNLRRERDFGRKIDLFLSSVSSLL